MRATESRVDVVQRDRRRAGLSGGTLSGIGIVLPIVVLAASYLWLTLDHATLLLWNVVVHESGRYTFGETALYWSHFLREVPVAVAYALFLMGLTGGKAGLDLSGDTRQWRLLGGGALLFAVVLAGVGFAMAASAHSTDSAMQDLLQYRTRDDVSAYGSHWHYHWLSTVWFGAAVAAVPVVLHLVAGAPLLRLSRLWSGVAWSYVLLLTLVFGASSEIFFDVRYAGHQVREILTHGLVTLPLGLAIVLAAHRSEEREGQPKRRFSVQSVALGAVILIPLYLAAVALGGDVMAEGQAEMGLSGMIAAHFFEHTLDYLFVVSLLLGGLALRRVHRSEDARPHDHRTA